MGKTNKMIKKKILGRLLIVAAFIPMLPAIGNTAGNLYKSGVYAGASVGYTYLNTKLNDSMHVPAPANFAESKSGKASKHAINGGVFLGHRHFFADGWLGGLEVELARDNAIMTKKFELGTLTNRLTLRNSYKFSPVILLGKQLNERWLGFIKVGMTLAQFKGKHSLKHPTEPEETEKFKARKTGLVLGAGAEYALKVNLSTIGSVTYERFGNIKKQYKNISLIPGEKNTGSFKPSYITTKIGLAYRF